MTRQFGAASSTSSQITIHCCSLPYNPLAPLNQEDTRISFRSQSPPTTQHGFQLLSQHDIRFTAAHQRRCNPK